MQNNEIINWLNKNQGLVAVIIFVLTITVGWISGLFRFIFNKFSPRGPYIKAGGDISSGGDIVVGNKNTKITNISSEAKVERTPFLVLHVRDIKDYPKDKQQKIRDEGYLITHIIKKTTNDNIYEAIEGSNYFLRLRNEGGGVALNVRVESDNFTIVKYQNHQISLQDEQSIKVVRKPNNKIRDLKELNGEILKIYCDSETNIRYCFKYKIVDIEQREVQFKTTNG